MEHLGLGGLLERTEAALCGEMEQARRLVAPL